MKTLLVVCVLAVCGLAFERSAAADDVKIEVKGGELFGTLEIPGAATTSEKPSIVVIVAGSGPTDRDGNNPIGGKSNCLKMLAEGMKAAGVASVRYDKRGIGASAKALGKEVDQRFDHYADDVAAWIAWAKKDGRFGKVFVLGHSEGALLGTVAAQKEAVEGMITISGPARPAAEVLKEQLNRNLPESQRKEAMEITDSLVAGKTVDKVPLWAFSLYRPSVQPYVISWFKYDPAKEVEKLKVPMLIVHGTTDIQVPPSEAKLLAKAAGDRGKVVMIEGMNHVLKKAEGDLAAQKKIYADPKLPLVDGLLEAVVGFVKGKPAAEK